MIQHEDQEAIIHSASKNLNIIHTLKDMIVDWRARADKETEVWQHARGIYRKSTAKIMKKRRHSLDVVRKVLREEYEDMMKEASDVKNLLVKEGGHEISHDDIDSKLVPENAKTSDEVAPVIPEQLSNEDITLHGIADFLNKMSKRDKVLMKNMLKLHKNGVEQELRKAANGKMAQTAWY